MHAKILIYFLIAQLHNCYYKKKIFNFLFYGKAYQRIKIKVLC